MTTIEIPEQEERLCINCTRKGKEPVYTQQIPVSIRIYHSSRGCFGSNRTHKWNWECLECNEVDV